MWRLGLNKAETFTYLDSLKYRILYVWRLKVEIKADMPV